MKMIPWGAPITVLKDNAGMIVSCWKLSFGERLRVFFFGRIYVASQSQFVRPMSVEPDCSTKPSHGTGILPAISSPNPRPPASIRA